MVGRPCTAAAAAAEHSRHSSSGGGRLACWFAGADRSAGGSVHDATAGRGGEQQRAPPARAPSKHGRCCLRSCRRRPATERQGQAFYARHGRADRPGSCARWRVECRRRAPCSRSSRCCCRCWCCWRRRRPVWRRRGNDPGRPREPDGRAAAWLKGAGLVRGPQHWHGAAVLPAELASPGVPLPCGRNQDSIALSGYSTRPRPASTRAAM